ncbi:MAG TPA: hypothetical protein VGY32_02185 [Solirubrobacteraceae bacterium]|nr:hypothetical protein [Solirubrobacteraceae bacterium]
MRFWLLPAVIGGLITGCAASAVAQTSRAGAACGPPSARTLAIDASARVYATGGFVYGCSDRPRRITRLGRSGSCIGGLSGIERVALAGVSVAYAVHHCGVDFGFTDVLVRNLRDGTSLGTFAATEKSVGPEATNSVSSLVVSSDGAAAWIGTAQSIISTARETEVRTGHGHRRQLLDSGTQIKTGSLRLHGSRLTWRHGRATRSATLQ